jgi:hypothetical protein
MTRCAGHWCTRIVCGHHCDILRRVSQKRLEKESTHFLLRLSDERGGSDSTGNVGNMEEEEEEEEELGEEGDVLCHITLSSPPQVRRLPFCRPLTAQTFSRTLANHHVCSNAAANRCTWHAVTVDLQAGLHDLAKDLAWAAGVKEEHITVLAVKNAGTRADVKIAKNCDPDGERLVPAADAFCGLPSLSCCVRAGLSCAVRCCVCPTVPCAMFSESSQFSRAGK